MSIPPTVRIVDFVLSGCWMEWTAVRAPLKAGRLALVDFTFSACVKIHLVPVQRIEEELSQVKILLGLLEASSAAKSTGILPETPSIVMFCPLRSTLQPPPMVSTVLRISVMAPLKLVWEALVELTVIF